MQNPVYYENVIYITVMENEAVVMWTFNFDYTKNELVTKFENNLSIIY